MTLNIPINKLLRSASLVVAVALLSATSSAFAAAPSCRPQLKGKPMATDAVQLVVSPCGGGVESVRLLGEQFAFSEPTGPQVVPAWAKAKWGPGGLQLVDTWSAKWDPFRDRLEQIAFSGPVSVGVAIPGSTTVTDRPLTDVNAWAQDQLSWGVVSADATSVSLVWPDPQKVKSPVYLLKTVRSIPKQPRSFAVELEVWNLAPHALKFRLEHTVSSYTNPKAEGGGFLSMLSGPPDEKGASLMYDGELRHFTFRELMEAIEDKETEELSGRGPPSWLGVDSRYFLLATRATRGWSPSSMARIHAMNNGVLQATLRSGGEALGAGSGACVPSWYATRWGGISCAQDLKTLALQKGQGEIVDAAFFEKAKLAAGADKGAAVNAAIERLRARQVKRFELTLYTGPKQIDLLREADASLESAIDFGWFGAIGRPLLSIMRGAHGLTGSWPLAIILLTMLVKLVFWPIMSKSMRSMRKMQALKPELDRIRDKLTDEARARGEDRPDPQAVQQQTMALYKRHGVNPLGGCLPMFLQMPVYIALYRTIYSSVELFHQPLFGWIHDLTEKDPYYVLPLVLGGLMFAQQRLMPSPGADPSTQKMMMYLMPGMFAVMMMQLPSGLVLYILVNTLLSIVQNIWLRREDKPARA